MLRDLLKARSVKGKEWAAEFVQHIQKSGLTIAEVDEQLMTGWFANAIEVAKTVTSERRQRLLDKANEMLKVQEQSYDYDQYMHGLYNGMEFVLCLIEDRDPQFKSAPAVWGADKPYAPVIGVDVASGPDQSSVAMVSIERKVNCPGDCNFGMPCQTCGSNGKARIQVSAVCGMCADFGPQGCTTSVHERKHGHANTPACEEFRYKVKE